MKIIVKQAAGAVIVHLEGRLDLSTGSNLKEEIKKVLEKGARRIHLNLQKVDFINSSGLGALVSIRKQVRTKKARLTISNLGAHVQEIFEVTQLSQVFEIFATEPEALGSTEKVAIE